MTLAPSFAERTEEVANLLATRPLVRAINFHNTSRARVGEYERQFAHVSQHFSSVTEDDLDQYLGTGNWPKSKPGMILAFYEGYRNGYDVIAPLLERYNLVGWFFVITGFVDAPPANQLAYAKAHGIDMITREYPDGRYAMTWEELKELDRTHVVGSHARSHSPLSAMSRAARELEILGSQQRFEKQLGHPVRTFVSWGGPAHGEDPLTDELVEKAGYRFVVSNYKIQRIVRDR